MRQTTSYTGNGLQLIHFADDTDPEAFAADLAPGFGGDEAPAREILAETCALLTRDPRPDPWGSYLVHLDGRPIGIAAFKSAPTPDEGEVEIAYMTFPAFEGRGHATATIAALVEIAEAAGAAPIAHTLPEENGSNTALRRNGFVYAGEVDDPEDGLIWRWVKDISG
jgi:ribosomal-protein-alanine N-acetyltransferase